MERRKGAVSVQALAILLMAAGCMDDTDDDKEAMGSSEPLKCQGGNECAGMSECASPAGQNDCQGMNSCKSMGWVTVDSKAECDDLGGAVIESES